MGIDYSLLGIEPVSEKFPAGKDVRYEENFELLQMEIDKLSSPTERNSFSWETVVDFASKILKKESKDILVASYLCVGLIHVNGSNGLDQASKIYNDLITNFWEDLFPSKKRIMRRISAIKWWIEKTLSSLEEGFKLDTIPETFQNIVKRFNQIQDFLENNPEFGLSGIELARKIKGLEPLSKAAEISTAQGIESLTNDVALTADIEILDADDAAKALNPVFQQLRQASKILREDKAYNPQAYKWLRFGLWEPVKSLPIATDGVTKLPPPSQQTIAHLENLKNDGDWKDLLLHSESALNNQKNIFFFDLNWFSAEALVNLGEKYKTAHEIVCKETYQFISRIPGIEDLHFSDGTGFASEEAKQWLKNLNDMEMDGSKAHEPPIADNDEKGSVAQIIAEARTLLKKRKGKITSADYLQHSINTATSQKNAFLIRLELVRILVLKKNEKIAMGHLNRIFDDIARYRLDDWEPEIALNGLKTIYKIFKKQTDIKYKQKAGDVFNMIATISAIDAMSV